MKDKVKRLHNRILKYKNRLNNLKILECDILSDNTNKAIKEALKESYRIECKKLLEEYKYLTDKECDFIDTIEKDFCEKILKVKYEDSFTVYLDLSDEEYEIYENSKEGKLVELLKNEDLNSFKPEINKDLLGRHIFINPYTLILY